MKHNCQQMTNINKNKRKDLHKKEIIRIFATNKARK